MRHTLSSFRADQGTAEQAGKKEVSYRRIGDRSIGPDMSCALVCWGFIRQSFLELAHERPTPVSR